MYEYSFANDIMAIKSTHFGGTILIMRGNSWDRYMGSIRGNVRYGDSFKVLWNGTHLWNFGGDRYNMVNQKFHPMLKTYFFDLRYNFN